MIKLFTLLLVLTLPAVAQQPSQSFQWKQKVFIENKGQVVDQNNKPNSEVRYIYNDGLMNLALKPSGFSYEVFKVEKSDSHINEATGEPDREASDYTDRMNINVTSQRIDVTFAGANRNVEPIASQQTACYFNYIFAPVVINQHLHVNGYRKITYPNLYKGIDLVFYADDDVAANDDGSPALRYEFIIHPGADLTRIKFLYHGAGNPFLASSGDFELNTSYGSITETQPFYFIDGKQSALQGAFVVNGNEKKFSPVDYDHSKFLVIDPNIIWGSYYGGELNDEIAELVVDTKSRPTIDGGTVSINHIASSGAYQSTFGGGVFDFFIARFKSSGKLDWATYFGGDDKENCFGLGIDNNNHPIAIGNSESQGLATPGAFKDSVLTASSDILIAKFSTDGSLMWSTYFGGEAAENARSCVCDSRGKIYLAGTTGSATGIAYGNAFQSTWGGIDDTWLAKFNKDGQPIWSTYYGDSGVDRAHAVNIDKMGHLFVGGTCSSRKNIASPGTFHYNYGGGTSDAFLAKFDTAGNYLWGTYAGGAEADRVRGVECDSAGNVYLGGFTYSDTGLATIGSFQSAICPPPGGGAQTEDAYLLKFNTAGKRLWGTYYGGAKDEEMWGMTSDNKIHRIYIMGSTASLQGIAYGSPLQATNPNGASAFLAKFGEDGSIEFGSYFSGKTGFQFEDAMPDLSGYLFVAGRSTSNSMPVTGGTWQATYGGGVSDAMIYKFYAGSDCLDQYEPNDSYTNCYLLRPVSPSDSTIYGWNGNIVNSNDQDWFKVKMNGSNNCLQIILQDLPVNYDLKFYDHAGNLLYQSLHSDLTPDTITANNLSAATYSFAIVHDPAVFDSLGCYHLRLYSSTIPFRNESGQQPQSPPDNLKVFPNPAQEEISVTLNSPVSQQAGLKLFDLTGREVLSRDMHLTQGAQQISFPLTGLSSGVFEMVIRTDGNIWKGRFVKL